MSNNSLRIGGEDEKIKGRYGNKWFRGKSLVIFRYLLPILIICSRFYITFITFLYRTITQVCKIQIIKKSSKQQYIFFFGLRKLQSLQINKQVNQIKTQMKNTSSIDNLEEQQVHYIGQSFKSSSRKLQTQQIFIDKKYDSIRISIKNINSEKMMKIQTQFYVIEVVSNQSNAKWEIQRRYTDFQWLFNALNYSYPGCILPYFPTKSIETFMITKLSIQYGEESKQQHLNVRKDELEVFLNGICKHSLLKQAQETKIFLNENKEQFLRKKKAIQAQIAQSQSQQSTSNGIVSIFERSMAWITSSSQAQTYKMEDNQGWDKTQKQIRLWVYQYSTLLEKVQKLIELKRSEIEWEGPQTQIDSVEQLKARVVSGQQYNKIFEQDLQQNILKNIEYQTKSLKQLQNQLGQRQNIIKIINYIYKYATSTNRTNKLLRKKQKFEINMNRQWPIFKEQLRIKIRAVQKKFNQIWLKYCRKVQKIWRQK